MPSDFSLPSIDDFHDYLRYTGWVEQSPGGPAGALWARNGARVGVPSESESRLMQAAIERVATLEERSPKEIAQAARYFRFDVTNLRAANDYRITDTIPLETAGKIIVSARSMFRATATTARKERAQIGKNYSRIGDGVVSEALMGHTEKGSFVIPILVPLSNQHPRNDDQLALAHQGDDEFVRSSPEPFERRVVRTFAQSMQAMQQVVVDRATDPSTDQIHELVYRGVSREFCSALAGILAEPAVAEFGVTVKWAPSVPAPTATVGTVSIDAEAVDLVTAVAKRLRQQRVDPRQIFSGTIVQFRHESLDDPFGEIAISTVRRGKTCEVTVRLPIDRYREAWEWHDAGRAVLVEGNIQRGRPLRVNDPVRCHPLDEAMLGGDETQAGDLE